MYRLGLHEQRKMRTTMMQRLRHLQHDEQGLSLVFVGMGFMAFFAATTLSIDVGMLMTPRTQAQNAADARAPAGATALAFNSFTDHSPSTPAVTSPINHALANLVIDQAVSAIPTDGPFP